MALAYESEKSRATELFQRLEEAGVEMLRTLYEDQKNEELFLDYKRIATQPGAKGLHSSDRGNLKKALSGFANADGGVIIWGLGTSKAMGPDRLEEPTPYADATGFAGLVDDAVSGCTTPPVPGVRSIAVLVGAGPEGYVATLIPASPHVPHQTADDQRAYYMRAGSSFAHVPHSVLAALFGRPPRPTVFMNFALRPVRVERSRFAGKALLDTLILSFNAMCVNNSGVVARDAYVAWTSRSLPGERCNLDVFDLTPARWTTDALASRKGSSLALEGNRIAPFSAQTPLSFKLSIRTPIESDFEITFTTGCDGVPPTTHSMNIGKEAISKEFTLLRVVAEGTHLSEDDAYAAALRLLNAEADRTIKAT